MRWILYFLVLVFPNRAIRLGAVYALTVYYSGRTRSVLQWVEEYDRDPEVRLSAALVTSFTESPIL